MRIPKYLIAFCFLISLIGCKSQTEFDPKTKTEILLNYTWQVQEVNATGYLSGQVYLRGRTPEGSQYDVSKVRLTFKSDGTCTAIDNTGNSTTTGNWKLSNSDTKLIISNTNNYLLDGEGDVITVSKTEFTFGGSRTYKNTTVQATVKMTPVP
jgi:Lipocalin-like domain